MLTTILILVGDLALGAAAYKLARSNEKSNETNGKILQNHEDRITKLESKAA